MQSKVSGSAKAFPQGAGSQVDFAFSTSAFFWGLFVVSTAHALSVWWQAEVLPSLAL